jgi:hypothetical protein
MVKRRVQEMAETVLSEAQKIIDEQATSTAVASLIRTRCASTLQKFGK